MSSSPQKTVILDVVGLSRGLITAEYMPYLHSYISQKGMVDRDIEPAFPALTCPGQSTFLTGTGPSTHGLIGNVSISVLFVDLVVGPPVRGRL